MFFSKKTDRNSNGIVTAKQPKVSDSFKKDVIKLSYDELKKKYKGLISSQNSYQGTGYGYVVRSPKQLLEDQFIMKRYRELKREADAKQAAHMAELSKYHYLNLYKHILETGRRPDGTPATDLEKKIAPYVVPIGNLVEAGKGFAVAASGYAAYQSYYGKPILGVDTNWLGKPKVPKTTTAPVVEKPTTKIDFYVDNDGIIRTPHHQKIQNIIEDLSDISLNKYGPKNYQSKGGYGQALKDFDSINLTGVKEFIIPGDRGVGKVGYMNDGTKVVVRSWSSDASSNSPTLEIQYKDSPILDRGIKIRY